MSIDGVFAENGTVLFFLLLVAFVVLLVMHLRLQSRVTRMAIHYQRLVRSGTGANLEELLDRHLDQIEQTTGRVAELETLCQDLERSLERSIQRVGLVRFNPFSDTGGDQSFSIALLDANGDGLVLSSLFSRAETRVFAKPIQGGQSKYNLTEEEQEAIHLSGVEHRSVRSR